MGAWWEEEKNCCFCKEKGINKLLQEHSRTKTQERTSLFFPPLLGLNIGSTKNPNEKQTRH